MRLIDADQLIKEGYVLTKHGTSNCVITTKSIADVPTALDVNIIAEQEKTIKILGKILYNSDFGRCYMCSNPMKNVTLDGFNNGCDGLCNFTEKYSVDEFLNKINKEIKAGIKNE